MTINILSSIFQISKRFLIQKSVTKQTSFPKFLSTSRDKNKEKANEREVLNLDEEERYNLNPVVNNENQKQIKSKLNSDEGIKALKTGSYHGIQYPTATTHGVLLVNESLYKDLPIIHIKSTKNNTIFSLTDARGKVLYSNSAGSVGFKNAKRGTTTAAQAAAIALSDHTKRRGFTNLRVVTQGIGNGRLASIKSIQMAGLNIISLTDKTIIPVPYMKPMRPRKRRKV